MTLNVSHVLTYVYRECPLCGAQDEQLIPGLLQQDGLISERQLEEGGDVPGPLHGHEQQPSRRLVCVLCRRRVGVHVGIQYGGRDVDGGMDRLGGRQGARPVGV